MAQVLEVGKGRRRSSEAVADELLEAALVEFAAHGYEGSSTRAIARRAGWHQPQINYHFRSKELLWQAAVDRLFAELNEVAVRFEDIEDDPVAVFVDGIERFVRFSARRPELHRIMGLESTADSARLSWIVDRYTAPLYEQVARAWAAVRKAGHGADLDPAAVWQLVVGVGAHPFAYAPEARRVVGSAPAAADQVALLRQLLGL